jgi:hypothetical protein
MFEKLPRGLVLKSGTYENGETFYTIILRNRLLFPWANKTARLYKNWEDDSSPLEISSIISYDFRDYSKYIRSDILNIPDDEEVKKLRGLIEELPQKKREKIYGGGKINLINKIEISFNDLPNPAYISDIQKIYDIDSLPNSRCSNTQSLLKTFPKKRSYQRRLPII